MNAVLSPNPAAFRLGDLLVYPATGRVEGPGGEVHLEPRVMAVLESLARRQGELVSRVDLLAEIWPGGDIYDEALTQCVYQLRQQLLTAGGSAESRSLISTVPKRGYVLKAGVELIDPAPALAGSALANRKRWPLALLAAVLVLAAGWLVYRWAGQAETLSPTGGTNSVAVLPFLPLVADSREPVLELGMADTLVTKLSGIGDLVVRPMSSARRYSDLERDSLQAGRQLGVDTVVDGSLQRYGDTLRVSVRLLRVADGQALWAETVNEPYSNIFQVQDEICARIATALLQRFGQDERRELARGGTSNPEAYERYLQGRYHLVRLTPRDLRESLEHFRAAVELDPDYTQAWLGLANVQFRLPIAGEAKPLEYYPHALEAAHRALELDPNSAEAYAMLGWIAHWYQWDWAASEANFIRANELNPNDTETHLGYAHLLSTTGRLDEAVVEARRARELSPNYMLAAALEGGFLLRGGQREEALRQMEAARAVGDDLWLFRVTLGGAYAANGRLEEALAEFERAQELSGGSTWVMSNELSLLLRMGKEEEAASLFTNLLQLAHEQYVPSYNLAVAYKTMGDLDSAMRMLEKSLEDRDPKLVFVTRESWGTLKDRPQFQHIVQALNLPPASE